jgi:hypothetical protein
MGTQLQLPISQSLADDSTMFEMMSTGGGIGLDGQAYGVDPYGDSGIGVYGASDVGVGVMGVATGANGIGVQAESYEGPAVFGHSSGHNAIVGQSKSLTDSGVWGINDGGGYGVSGSAQGPSGIGVQGINDAVGGVAVLGRSGGGHGVHGVNDGGSGVRPDLGAGVWGESNHGYGVFGSSLNSDAGRFVGNVSVTGTLTVHGDIMLPSADCAEEFDCAAGVEEPGTVMAIDDEGALSASVKPYDRRVAGVVSGAGNYRPALILDRNASTNARVAIALVGKVYCKVDAQYGAVAIGDLLTTSPTRGHAMQVSDPASAFGAVIGKALQPLRDGRGLIPILVALQ